MYIQLLNEMCRRGKFWLNVPFIVELAYSFLRELMNEKCEILYPNFNILQTIDCLGGDYIVTRLLFEQVHLYKAINCLYKIKNISKVTREDKKRLLRK